jgi:hypothetical protein
VGIELLTERYAEEIEGVLGCWDRMLIFGTLPKICFAEGMTSYLYERRIKIFDYPRFAEPFRNQLRENAEQLAAENGIEIEVLRKRNVRKEDRVKEILARRGDHPGRVCILSAMEPCSTYKPWHNKQTGRTYLLPDDGKCLHYYFYFLDEELGCATCGSPPGCRAGCRSTAMGTTGWPLSYAGGISISSCWTTRLCGSRTGAAPNRSSMGGRRSGFTQDWMVSPADIAPSFAPLGCSTTGVWISANTPPTSSSAGRPIWRPFTGI